MFHRKIYLYIAMTLCLVPLAGLSTMALAAGRDRIVLPAIRPLSWDCVVDAADRYTLPLAALVGILATEGGKTGEALSNTNGTWDMGAFQVNTCHVNELLRAFHLKRCCGMVAPTLTRRPGFCVRNTTAPGISGMP